MMGREKAMVCAGNVGLPPCPSALSSAAASPETQAALPRPPTSTGLNAILVPKQKYSLL